MQSNAKAVALIRDLADKLSKRYAGSATIDTVRQAFDSNNWPYLLCSDGGVETAGNPVIFIRISNPDMISKDIFGSQTYAYAPHIMEFAYELTAANNPIPTDADLFIANFEAVKTGCREQVKETANTVAVNPTNVSAASAIADLDDLYWPTKSV